MEDLQRRREEEQRPVREAGGGQAEGFEQAEEELVEHASHGEETGLHIFPAEIESDLSGAVYGEPDEVDPTEVTRDPHVKGEDPGEGPGIAAER